ncbi:MAG: RluA family pseudouridine synthase, partial [Vicinamibacterales bacterium]
MARTSVMPESQESIHFVADRGDARLRLDQAIVRNGREIVGMSRNRAQAWIEAGSVTVDGRQASRPASRVRAGATIEIALPIGTLVREQPRPEARPLDVVYRDQWLVAVNKPPGLVVHPSYKNSTGTLLNALLWGRPPGGPVPGIITRLDKDTSGLVLVALTRDVHAAVQRDAAAGRVRKEYLAVVHGVPHPGSGTIRLPLGRDPNDRRRVIVTERGQPSETKYEVIRIGNLQGGPEGPPLHSTHQGARRGEPSGPPASIVRCELVTGRTHQIRVHLAAMGWPVLGDRVYGERHPA